MKLHVMPLGVALALLAGSALAAGRAPLASAPVLPQVNVAACVPPTDAPQCAEFHRALRANFSQRELGMLFGASSVYPEYRTGGIEHLRKRLDAMIQQYVAAHAGTGAAGTLTSR